MEPDEALWGGSFFNIKKPEVREKEECTKRT